jgi:histone-lysine N-methyltransferase SETMAR
MNRKFPSTLSMSTFVPENSLLRGNLLFCFFLGKKPTEAIEMLKQAFGEHALGRSQCFEWYKKFQAGDFDIANQPRGRPLKKIEDRELQKLLDEDPCQTQQRLADELGVTRQTVSLRLKAMGKIQKAGKWLPHELTERQQERRMVISENLLVWHRRKPFLYRIVTGDEKWIYFENPKRKSAWLNPGQAVPSTPKPNHFGKKAMLCVFWDQKGLIYYELLKTGETVDAKRYGRQMIDLTRILYEKRPEWHDRHNKKILHHDNAPSHTSGSVKKFLEELRWELLPHPPYSPDLAPSDYHLFASLGHALGEQRFANFEEAKKWLDSWFASKPKKFFEEGIRKLPERWAACISSGGAYFE